MNILHTVSGIWKHTGGPAEVIPLLCLYLNLKGAKVTLATLDGDLSDTVIACSNRGVDLIKYPIRIRHRPWYSNAMRKGINALVSEMDIVHSNGIWEYTNWHTANACIRMNKPFVISFHGALSNYERNWSFRHKTAWELIDGPLIRKASCLHACSDEEFHSIRSLGLGNPVAIIPNGIEMWHSIPVHERRNLVPEFANMRNMLFLSRIHPLKGIFDLVKIWHELRPDEIKNWQLIIIGPGDDGNISLLNKLIKFGRNKDSIKFLGALYGDKRIAAYQSADIVILPSYSENFGVVVGEALASGKPVITTHNVPWPALQVHQCGWWIPHDKLSILNCIKEAIQLDEEKIRSLGENGRKLIEKEFSWPVISGRMLLTYEWLLKKRNPPEFIKS